MLDFKTFITNCLSRACLDETSPVFKMITRQAITYLVEHHRPCTMRALDVQHACEDFGFGIEASEFDESMFTSKLAMACKARVVDILSEEFHITPMIALDAAKHFGFLSSDTSGIQ
eukprot:Nitzschia sp. Nitz4//scaffold100_size80364//47577//47924//NITZ4_005348-RA/size80364-processed-gene-0.56-mRNA-1//-1//CDS//3329532106//3942//frame0